jgi:hypothetical protein
MGPGQLCPVLHRQRQRYRRVRFSPMQVVERFFSLGTWRNMWRRLDLTVYDNTLTIPRGFDTCRAIGACGGGPAPIYSQFHRFAGYGVAVDPVGNFGPIGSDWFGGLRLIDESAQTFRKPTGTFTLRAVAQEANATGFTFIGGRDQNGTELFGQTTLAFVNGAADGTQQYTRLPEIQKAVTSKAVLLYSVDTTSGVATLLASYAPGETIPSYRQYSAHGLTTDNNQDGISDQTLSAICKLAFCPALSPNDLVIPGNLGSLKLGLMSLGYEEHTDPQNAKIYMDNAIALLDAELGELEGAEAPAMNFSRDYGCGSIPSPR